MNGIGRQGQRSTAAGLQDCALYGGGGGEEGGLGSRMCRNVRRGSNAGNDFSMEHTTPPFSSLPSGQRKNGEESPSDFSPGLIDLHSFVAELLPEVRKRSLNKKGLARNEEDIIETVSNSLVVHETKLKVDLTEHLEQHEFVFDAVLKEEVSNDELSCTYRYFSCPGGGKTYTMKPLPLKASRDILRLMHHTYRNQGFQLFVSFFEIYGGKLFDLLNVETIKELIEKGSATRSTGTSGANEESSRSHAILKLAIKRSVDGTESKPPRLMQILVYRSGWKWKSLLALKECIRALDNDQGHIPFRSTTSGVKSLSEGRNPKKDLLSSTLNLKELIAQPLSSVLPTALTFEDDINGTWADQNERDDFDASEDPFEKEKMTWKKIVKPDQYSSSVSEDKLWKPNETCSANDSYVQSLVFSFTQEEEDLVNAHRKQVETMNIVKEEVNLLVEADRPGKQQDGYISRLNAIFSQKADDVVQLQTQIAHFEKLYRSRTF
ncbi:hypothetical protein Godav_008543 [Gossypium davidsonii]|uniref:Kinesin motor domain-containing protein n=1 Tax=Gossypium davidsonii TaxID=34287 RepID=A0A7J8SAF4_GOSDV|nr:hypothetical protein [Gossypium davidsonii]